MLSILNRLIISNQPFHRFRLPCSFKSGRLSDLQPIKLLQLSDLILQEPDSGLVGQHLHFELVWLLLVFRYFILVLLNSELLETILLKSAISNWQLIDANFLVTYEISKHSDFRFIDFTFLAGFLLCVEVVLNGFGRRVHDIIILLLLKFLNICSQKVQILVYLIKLMLSS